MSVIPLSATLAANEVLIRKRQAGEPPELAERIARSRSLHEAVCRAVADRFAATGVIVPEPQAAFYLYPDFAPWRQHLAERHGVTTGAGLARLLLDRHGAGAGPGLR